MLINSQSLDLEFCPYIDTEKTIIEQLKISSEKISDEFELMPFPLAHMINTLGIQKTNDFINSVESTKKRIFICQHIYVNQLNFFHDDIIFTPHATINDNFYCIPHFAVNQNKEFIENEKKYLFSFLGSIKTHWTREKIVKLYPNCCFDSGEHWGLNSKEQDFKTKYISLLGKSIFSICPRGTGISTVRLFESMAMNSIPVIIADGYKKPLQNKLDWNSFSVSIPENNINQIEEILKKITITEIEKMKEKVNIVYNNYFNNENLSKSIIELL